MRQFIKHTRLFGWLAAAALLLTTSCKDELFGDNGRSDEVTVTFNLTPEAATTVATRADDDSHVDYANKPRISDGSKADMLIYAVYDKDDNLLTGYSDGTDEELKALGFNHGDGQTIKKIKEFPTTVTLTLKRGEVYKIAFWAQSSRCMAYDTKDLKKVEVIYNAVAEDTSTDDSGDDSDTQAQAEETAPTATVVSTLNNDEMRDAFCRSVEIVAGADGSMEKNVYLYRPLAQINVGTVGYDFEAATRGAQNKDKYLYSKIRLNRVARYLDVVEDQTYTTTTTGDKAQEAFAVVDFDYAPIAAYVNMGIPEKPSYTVWDWDYNDGVFNHPDNKTKADYAAEEFLKLHLYERDENHELPSSTNGNPPVDAEGYLGYANYNNYLDCQTEVFKYLSMCYVLTASTKDERTTIDNVKVWLATSDKPGTEDFDEIEIVNLNNVPAQRNWRTNIVGNIMTEKARLEVKLDKDFAGEYNGWANGDKDGNWRYLTGPIAKGVYYDAENNEIQISDADGLLWLQRMVNGDLKVRVAEGITSGENKPTVGKYYYYYPTDQKQPFVYDGYMESDYDPVVQARILKATNSKAWPENNNFHFAGAKVKLMADIDLTGINWIPIGFDYKIAELKSHYKGKDAFAENVAENRGFYGTFDGNNHTISHLTTQRFSAQVDEDYYEQDTEPRNYDAFPWFGRGLFGAIGGDAKIQNVRLYDVDILGCQGVGGVVGIAYGNKIEISNCIVDNGKLTATPLYRNDRHETNKRTFARGCFLGGIVGYFNTRGGKVTGCSVRNLTIKGYRQVGGLIGTIDRKYGSNSKGSDEGSAPLEKGIANNTISNTVVVASQLHFPFGLSPVDFSKETNNEDSRRYGSETELGFGWTYDNSFDLYAGEWIGGDTDSYLSQTLKNYFEGNSASGLTFSEMTETVEKSKPRVATIGASTLQLMPALSSWFADKIDIRANYYGAPSARTKYHTYAFASSTITNGTKYLYPMHLPLETEIHWDEDSPRVGLYVESVTLDGGNNVDGSGRSVITPTDVADEGACMYVTARDRKGASSLYLNPDRYAQPTEISNVVLRGSPYAYTGLLLAPNENMSAVKLTNVAIYDVYQTLALDEITSVTGRWPQGVSAETTTLELTKCNLRGYTVPGSGWQSITYTTTTFEQGMVTGKGTVEQAQTCKVADGVETTFTGCYFKAPYIIDLSAVTNLSKVTFTNCQAAAASKGNKKFDDAFKISDYSHIEKIEIESDVQGNPVVKVKGTKKSN